MSTFECRECERNKNDFGWGMAFGAGAVSAIVLIIAIFGSTQEEFRHRQWQSDTFCTEFAPTFQLNEDGTWECLTEDE